MQNSRNYAVSSHSRAVPESGRHNSKTRPGETFSGPVIEETAVIQDIVQLLAFGRSSLSKRAAW
ncbi:hypothetical protein Vi05172_g11027 [Venturia inaequalis]|nr:hypothetical protein Vi05172_g11027 [Venturia inaequalis]